MVPSATVAAQTLRRSWAVELPPVRWAGAAMLGLGAALPHVAHNPGLPCPLRTLTGVPCPLCGMTTAVKAVCTGHLRSSVSANPFGLIAVAVAVVVLVRPSVRSVRVPVALFVAAAVTSWVWELRRFGFL